jgi:hypothetical protein
MLVAKVTDPLQVFERRQHSQASPIFAKELARKLLELASLAGWTAEN